MNFLTKLALKKRWLTFLVVIVVTAVSIWATTTLKQELIPDIELPITSIITVYPQASSENVMNKVTIPIESAIAESEGLKQIISTSTKNTSFVLAQFEYGTDMDKLNTVLKEKLDTLELPPEVRSLASQMPELGENPKLFPININMIPTVILSLSGDLPASELSNIAASDIVPYLEKIDGVYTVSIEGGTQQQIIVDPDPTGLAEAGVTLSQLAGVISTGKYGSLEQLDRAVVGLKDMTPVTLGDVAKVTLGLPQGTGITRTNGKPSIGIMVMKEPNANTVQVANAVLAEVERIDKNLSANIDIVTVLDQSEYIKESVNNLTRDAITGCILAIIIVFLFLMAFRPALVTAVSIPLSILIGFLVMRGFGLTVNILTLSAMAIAVGRVIDDSIVLLEVIYRRRQHGEGFKEAAINGAKEVAVPITSATLATVAIFIPLAFAGGIVGELFIPFALTITFALLASLIVSLTVVPALSSFPVSSKAGLLDKETWYQQFYVKILRWSLAHRMAIVAITIVLFVGSFALIPAIGTTLLPDMGQKILTVEIQGTPEINHVGLESVVESAEKVLGSRPEVVNYQTTIGSSNSLIGGFTALMGGGGDNKASIMVILDPDVNIEDESSALRQSFNDISSGAVINVSTIEGMASQVGFSGLNLSVQGDTLEDVTNASDKLVLALQDVDGLADLQIGKNDVVQEISITPDPVKLMGAGLTPAKMEQLQKELYLLVNGGTIASIEFNNQTYEVFMDSGTDDIANPVVVQNLRVGYPESLRLGDIATVNIVEQPVNIQRIDQKLAASVTANIISKDVGAVNKSVQEKIDSLDLPSGVKIIAGGVAREMSESFSSMYIAIGVAIVLAFVVLVVSFRSIRNSFIIMVSLPLASVGAFLGLLIAGQPIGVSALMGILMLVGIVLTNAIVLIAMVEQLRKGGMTPFDALIEAGRTRLRPILMTALTTIFAMLPLALGIGGGVLIAAELAIVVIGGLFSSTLLTLLVIPVIYSLFSGMRHKTLGSLH